MHLIKILAIAVFSAIALGSIASGESALTKILSDGIHFLLEIQLPTNIKAMI